MRSLLPCFPSLKYNIYGITDIPFQPLSEPFYTCSLKVLAHYINILTSIYWPDITIVWCQLHIYILLIRFQDNVHKENYKSIACSFFVNKRELEILMFKSNRFWFEIYKRSIYWRLSTTSVNILIDRVTLRLYVQSIYWCQYIDVVC